MPRTAGSTSPPSSAAFRESLATLGFDLTHGGPAARRAQVFADAEAKKRKAARPPEIAPRPPRRAPLAFPITKAEADASQSRLRLGGSGRDAAFVATAPSAHLRRIGRACRGPRAGPRDGGGARPVPRRPPQPDCRAPAEPPRADQRFGPRSLSQRQLVRLREPGADLALCSGRDRGRSRPLSRDGARRPAGSPERALRDGASRQNARGPATRWRRAGSRPCSRRSSASKSYPSACAAPASSTSTSPARTSRRRSTARRARAGKISSRRSGEAKATK